MDQCFLHWVQWINVPTMESGQTGHEIGKECGTTGDTDDDDNEEGGNMVAIRSTTSCEGKIRDDAS
ncbi:5337_t:CDS:2, partial [Cetraspora pellucida]